MIADSQEIQAEKEWAFQRPTVAARLLARGKSNVPSEQLSFEDLLTQSEADILQSYLETPQSSLRCFSLSQDARNDRGRQSGTQKMHCIVRNFGLVWAVEKKMVLPTRNFGCSGFFRDRTHATNSFCYPRDDRKRHVVSGQAGNSMNVNSVGVVSMYAMMLHATPQHHHNARHGLAGAARMALGNL